MTDKKLLTLPLPVLTRSRHRVALSYDDTLMLSPFRLLDLPLLPEFSEKPAWSLVNILICDSDISGYSSPEL